MWCGRTFTFILLSEFGIEDFSFVCCDCERIWEGVYIYIEECDCVSERELNYPKGGL